jgi:hypothetical protein
MAHNDVVYAVRRGRVTGIHETWDSCQDAVKGFSKPVWRKLLRWQAVDFLAFSGEDEARAYQRGLAAPDASAVGDQARARTRPKRKCRADAETAPPPCRTPTTAPAPHCARTGTVGNRGGNYPAPIPAYGANGAI